MFRLYASARTFASLSSHLIHPENRGGGGEAIKLFKDIRMHDNVLKQFNEQYPISNLLATSERFDRKTFFFYKYNHLNTYRATIYNYYFGDEQKRQLTIKLSHDGFGVQSVNNKSDLSCFDGDNYFILDETLLKDMIFLNRLKHRLQACYFFQYKI